MTYRIDYDDGDVEEGVFARHIRGESLALGAKVRANWQRRGRFFPGTIAALQHPTGGGEVVLDAEAPPAVVIDASIARLGEAGGEPAGAGAGAAGADDGDGAGDRDRDGGGDGDSDGDGDGGGGVARGDRKAGGMSRRRWDHAEERVLSRLVETVVDNKGRPIWTEILPQLPGRTVQEARCKWDRLRKQGGSAALGSSDAGSTRVGSAGSEGAAVARLRVKEDVSKIGAGPEEKAAGFEEGEEEEGEAEGEEEGEEEEGEAEGEEEGEEEGEAEGEAIPESEWLREGHGWLGATVRRLGHRASVTKWAPASDDGEDEALWHVVHDDGDEEDLDEAEMREALADEAAAMAAVAAGTAADGAPGVRTEGEREEEEEEEEKEEEEEEEELEDSGDDHVDDPDDMDYGGGGGGDGRGGRRRAKKRRRVTREHGQCSPRSATAMHAGASAAATSAASSLLAHGGKPRG